MLSVFSILMVLVFGTAYFVPSMVAIARRHANAMPIFLMNLYLGWTFLGWAGSLIWSFSSQGSAYAPLADIDTTGAPIAPSSGKKSAFGKAAKYIGGVLAFILLLIVIVSMLPAKTGKESGPIPSATGLPVPADELFGAVSSPAPAGGQ